MSKNTKGTPEERECHARAVALRKLTDKQLIERFNEQAKQASQTKTVAEFIKAIEGSNIRGFGAVTIAKLKKFAEENGF